VHADASRVALQVPGAPHAPSSRIESPGAPVGTHAAQNEVLGSLGTARDRRSNIEVARTPRAPRTSGARPQGALNQFPKEST
jgi:hypothetical protein